MSDGNSSKHIDLLMHSVGGGGGGFSTTLPYGASVGCSVDR